MAIQERINPSARKRKINEESRCMPLWPFCCLTFIMELKLKGAQHWLIGFARPFTLFYTHFTQREGSMLLFIFPPTVYHFLRLQFICPPSQSFAIPITPWHAHFSSKGLTRSMPINFLSSLLTCFIYYAIKFLMSCIGKKFSRFHLFKLCVGVDHLG